MGKIIRNQGCLMKGPGHPVFFYICIGFQFMCMCACNPPVVTRKVFRTTRRENLLLNVLLMFLLFNQKNELTRPPFPVQVAVVDGLGHIGRTDLLITLNVGYGPGNFQDPIISTH